MGVRPRLIASSHGTTAGRAARLHRVVERVVELQRVVERRHDDDAQPQQRPAERDHQQPPTERPSHRPQPHCAHHDAVRSTAVASTPHLIPTSAAGTSIARPCAAPPRSSPATVNRQVPEPGTSRSGLLTYGSTDHHARRASEPDGSVDLAGAALPVGGAEVSLRILPLGLAAGHRRSRPTWGS